MNDPTANITTSGHEAKTMQTFYASIGGLRGGQRNDWELFLGWGRDFAKLQAFQTQYEFGSLVTLRAVEKSSVYVVMAVIVNVHPANGPTALLCLKDDIEKTDRDSPVRVLVPIRKLCLETHVI
jgi:hypothetical protein